MDGREDRTEFDDLEDELLKWVTEWDEADEAVYAAAKASMIKLAKLKLEQLELESRLNSGGRKRRRKQRSHASHHLRLLEDWIGIPASVDAEGNVHESKEALQDDAHFNRRFRVGPKLFLRLLYEIQDPDSGHVEFQRGPDVTGEPSASALQKLTAVFRILAYGVAFDAVHDYTGIQEAVARKVFYGFCDWLSERYGGTYLGVWTPEAIAKEMSKNAERGFTGMLGSIDCTHWEWKNCPMPWQGQFQDRHGHRSVIAEAIAGHDMYFWHVFVGCPGSLNDLNVMGTSTLASSYMNSAAASTKFTVGDTEFEGAFFLADGIYPNYAYLMKTVSKPGTPAEKLFAKYQEAVRKDVERAFGRLLIKWHILNVAARTWFLENVKKIWRACFILHNMTIRDNDDTGYNSDVEIERAEEHRREQERLAREKAPLPTPVRQNPERHLDREDELNVGGTRVGVDEDDWERVLKRLSHMQSRSTNLLLKQKTVEALWESHGASTSPV